MKRVSLRSILAALLVSAALPWVATADSSHARIVRLRFLQGDVRVVREFHRDSVTDTNARWEVAQLNFPIRQGNALSTGNGRAEVEFENGAEAFLGANTVVEFYDLSLDDGARITRLILRQGTLTFHASGQALDYSSVTGGDFTVAAQGRATFRLENFDDGSTVNVLQGHVDVLEQNEKSTPLEKGQSFAIHAQDPAGPVLGRAPASDDFDRWVSQRIQNEEVVNSQLATTYGNPFNAAYTSGYSDLYTYGSWLTVGGFNCWRPFGVGLGWSPFDSGFGNWYFDQGGLGWSFLGTSPWGWLPYHYGGWILAPGYGWVWNPGGVFSGKPQPYRPVTAVFVHSGSTLAVVPMHPADKPGKTALNLAQGLYPIENGRVGKATVAAGNEKWAVERNTPGVGFPSAAAQTTAPAHVGRTIAASSLGARATSTGRIATIAYDSEQHRFVNTMAAKTATAAVTGARGAGNPSGRAAVTAIGVPPGARGSIPAAPSRAATPAPRPPIAPPARPSSASAGGPSWGGGSRGGNAPSSAPAPSRSSSAPAPAGGGRPH